MLHIKFQTPEPSGSEEEDFRIYFYAFLWFEPRTPWRRAMFDPDPEPSVCFEPLHCFQTVTGYVHGVSKYLSQLISILFYYVKKVILK